MNRNALGGAGAHILACLGLLLGLPSTATALPLIAEIFYDAVGSDDGQSFVELYGAPGTDLTGLVVEGVNGSNGAVTDSIVLSGVIPADGFFVLADDAGDGSTGVAGADQLADFDFQNGPDSVLLRSGATVLDAVGYGDFDPDEFFAGEATPAPDAPADSSLARHFANFDSDDNAADFKVQAIRTPGSGPLAPVPEPATALLLGLGLAGLARAERAGRAAG